MASSPECRSSQDHIIAPNPWIRDTWGLYCRGPARPTTRTAGTHCRPCANVRDVKPDVMAPAVGRAEITRSGKVSRDNTTGGVIIATIRNVRASTADGAPRRAEVFA